MTNSIDTQNSAQGRSGFLTQTAFVFAIGVLGQLIAFVVQAWVARTIGEDSFGTYTFVYSWIDILLVGGVLGLDQALIKFMPKHTTQNEWGLASGVLHFAQRGSLAVSLPITIVGIGIVVVSPLEPTLAWTFVLGLALLPLWSHFRVLLGALTGLHLVALAQSFRSIIRPAIWGATLLLAIRVFDAPPTAPTTMATQLGGFVLVTLGARYALRRSRPDAIINTARKEARREWLTVSLPLTLTNAMRIVLMRTDIILVGILIGTTEAGIYAVGSRLAQLLTFGLSASNRVVAPRISSLFSKNQTSQLQRLVAQSAVLSTVSMLILTGFLIATSNILLGFFGERFLEARPIFLILALMQLVNAATGPVGQLMNMCDEQLLNSKILATMLAVNLIANIPAVLAFGAIGAAWVTCAVGITRNLWSWIAVKRILNIDSSVISARTLIGSKS